MDKNLKIMFMKSIFRNKSLKPTERITLLHLLDQTDFYGPLDDSDFSLSSSLGISERTISSCVKRLKELNYIIVRTERSEKSNKRIIEINYKELEKMLHVKIENLEKRLKDEQ